jgi:hypothetical protein
VSVLIQLALVLEGTRHSGDTCSAAGLALDTQQGRRLTHRLYRLASSLRYQVLPAPGPQHEALPPRLECAVLATYMQLTLGD